MNLVLHDDRYTIFSLNTSPFPLVHHAEVHFTFKWLLAYCSYYVLSRSIVFKLFTSTSRQALVGHLPWCTCNLLNSSCWLNACRLNFCHVIFDWFFFCSRFLQTVGDDHRTSPYLYYTAIRHCIFFWYFGAAPTVCAVSFWYIGAEA